MFLRKVNFHLTFLKIIDTIYLEIGGLIVFIIQCSKRYNRRLIIEKSIFFEFHFYTIPNLIHSKKDNLQ